MSAFDLFLLIVIYGVGIAVLGFVSSTLLQAGRAANEFPTAGRLVAGLWIWAVLATLYALNTGTHFAWFGVAFGVPFAVGFGITFIDPVKRVLEEVSITQLVGVQVYRNAGAVFLIAYFFTDSGLSREFAMNAGWGDVLTGMLALPTALAAYYRIAFWRLLVVGWCLIGTGDLILAPATAFIYGGPGVNDFPLNVIPILFGPPLGILLHTYALRALWLQRRVADMNASAIAQAGRAT